MILTSSGLSLTQLPGIPLSADCVQTLHSAAAFRTNLLAQIASARQRIYLCSLYLQADEAGAEILDALHAAKLAHPKLDIHVLVDWHRAQRGLIGAGKQSGNSLWYREQTKKHASLVPIYGVPVQTHELFGVLHLKGFIIDDAVIYSGASLNNVYLHKCDKYRHDRYLLIQNKWLADCLLQFIQVNILSAAAVRRIDLPEIPTTLSLRREIRNFREQLKRARYVLPEKPQDTNQNGQNKQDEHGLTVTPLIGVGKNNPLNRVICQLLGAAEKQITICTPYFNFPLAVTREINRALKRGVNIDIIVGDKTANDFYTPPDQAFKLIASLPYLYEVKLRRFAKTHQKAIDNGQLNLHLWQDGENTYHLKGLWIDDHYSLMTGNNFNPRAFRLDLENALLIHDTKHELATQKKAELENIYQKTRRITHYTALQQLADYPPDVRKFLSKLSSTMMDKLAYRVL
jgi:CDP-diacylglycerol--serine O-phosphatidyltransferase